jgi:hypothetical protein
LDSRIQFGRSLLESLFGLVVGGDFLVVFIVPVVSLRARGGDDVLDFEETDGTGRQPGDYRNDKANSQHVFKSFSTFGSYYAQVLAVSMLSFSWNKIDKFLAPGHLARQINDDQDDMGFKSHGAGERLL